nr:MAG TPA: hypothetical protein [Caudoviricetes sp.]DAQ11079.1 MAG TPA: hypothetical protein [Caudoviricetes sp.]
MSRYSVNVLRNKFFEFSWINIYLSCMLYL